MGKALIDHSIILLTETGALRGTLDASLDRSEFDRWAADWALGSLEPAEIAPLLVAAYGREAILAALGAAPDDDAVWVPPVGEGEYPTEMWYAATLHDLSGTKPQPLGSPRKHTGLDLNLAFAERGDVERRLGLSVHAMAAGEVTYVTEDWNGAGMVVVRHVGPEGPEWWRYAHLVPAVQVGATVQAGQVLGPFADWKSGDHLHLDGADAAIEREWLTLGVPWFDPAERLQERLGPGVVEGMLEA
jgi:hypothetical protein